MPPDSEFDGVESRSDSEARDAGSGSRVCCSGRSESWSRSDDARALPADELLIGENDGASLDRPVIGKYDETPDAAAGEEGSAFDDETEV